METNQNELKENALLHRAKFLIPRNDIISSALLLLVIGNRGWVLVVITAITVEVKKEAGKRIRSASVVLCRGDLRLVTPGAKRTQLPSARSFQKRWGEGWEPRRPDPNLNEWRRSASKHQHDLQPVQI
jgi:hypothetical protein